MPTTSPGSAEAERSELSIQSLQLKKAAHVLRAINHGLRLQILQFIHEKERVIVTDIYKTLDLEQSIASQHLAILRRTGFVITARSGKYIFYKVNYERIGEVERLAGSLIQ